MLRVDRFYFIYIDASLTLQQKTEVGYNLKLTDDIIISMSLKNLNLRSMFLLWITILLSVNLSKGFLIDVEKKKGFGKEDQDWGYIEVRKGAHMFWWLYYVDPPVKSADFQVFSKPLIIWLQGGPGFSSTGLGNFGLVGPLDSNLKRRNHTLTKDYNVLFIDSPVGSGFSYVENDSKYAKNTTQCAQDLVLFMKNFLQTISGFKNVSAYIYGQSYSGKIASEFALLWYQDQENGVIESKLKGVALGSPWIAPIDLMNYYLLYLLNTGIVDKQEYNHFNKSIERINHFININDWQSAYTDCQILEMSLNRIINLNNILTEKVLINSFLNHLSGFNRSVSTDNHQIQLLQNLMNNEVKKILKLSVHWNFMSYGVYRNLNLDFMRSSTHIIERLLEETNLKIVIFTGQLDFAVSTIGTLSWLNKLQWKDVNKWKKSKRLSFSIDNIIEGYVKQYNNLKYYSINRSGHSVPADNPYAINAIFQYLTS